MMQIHYLFYDKKRESQLLGRTDWEKGKKKIKERISTFVCQCTFTCAICVYHLVLGDYSLHQDGKKL